MYSPPRIRVLIAFAALSTALLAAGCGGAADGDASDQETDRRSVRQPDARLSACVAEWNSPGNKGLRDVVAALARIQPNPAARMFAFSDGACGLTVPELGGDSPAVTTLVEHGASFGPYISTAAGNPDVSMITAGAELARRGSAEPNVEVGVDGTLTAPNYAEMPVEQLDSGRSNRPSYAVTADEWSALNLDEQIAAISDYAVAYYCTMDRIKRIAEALRDGTFTVKESAEKTLSAWCEGQLPAEDAEGRTSRGTPRATDSELGRNGDASTDPGLGESGTGCPAFDADMPDSARGDEYMRISAEGVSCTDAERLARTWFVGPTSGLPTDWDCSGNTHFTCTQGDKQIDVGWSFR